MISDRQNADELENLSALFDGELEGDAARFARKRLGHDIDWQQACGRWQLIGDALRGQATAAAPADFAGRVTAAVAAEPVPVLQPAPARAPARGIGRRWIGGALAASMALMAVFVARPPEPQSNDAAPASAAAPAPVLASSSATPSTSLAESPLAPAIEPAIETPAARNLAAAPTRDPATPSRNVEQAARASTARIARAVQQRAAGAAQEDSGASVILADAAPDPFRPRADIVTRPWPRAVLPNSQAAGALTASFEAAAPGSRSFYPFEPQAPADVPAARSPPPDF